MKKGLMIGITIAIEAILTWIIANYFHVRFIEVMFFSGLAFTVVIYWFSSSGGLVTRLNESQASAQTGVILKRNQFSLRMNPILTGSLIFLGIGLMIFILLLQGIIPAV